MKEAQKNRVRNKFYKIIPLFLIPFLALLIVNYTVPFNVSSMNPVEYTGIKKTSLKEAVSLEETMGLKKHSFSSDNNEIDKVPDKSAQALFLDAREALDSSLYGKAIQILSAIDSRFPFGPISHQVQLDLIYAYYKAVIQLKG